MSMLAKAIAVAAFFAASGTIAAQEKVDVAMLQRVAAGINQTLPKMQDQDTRFDRVSVGPGLTWTFAFTLVKLDYSKNLADSFKSNAAPTIVNQFCHLPLTQIFLEQGIASHLIHKDRHGKVVSDITLDRDRCR